MNNVKHNVWSLLSDREALTSASDAVIAKATGKDAIKAETAKAVAEIREALKEAKDAESFAKVVTATRERYGSQAEMVRLASATKAASQVMSALTRTIIREAFTRGLVGAGKHYPTQAALAAAVGVSGAYVTQCKPTPKDATKAKAGTKSAETKAETKADETETAKASPLVALQQALTRLETASGKAFSPEDYAEVLRVANALDVVAKNLRLVAKDAKTA